MLNSARERSGTVERARERTETLGNARERTDRSTTRGAARTER
jgi:hypothetical protein